LASQPVGWVVTQMKPRTRGLMIMRISLDEMQEENCGSAFLAPRI
jgi:hypothetical protein